MRSTSRVLTVALSLFVLAIPTLAQTFRGAIAGSVTDASGAIIPGAIVKATNSDTAFARSTVSSAAGDFLLPDLPLGPYSLSVTKDGFAVRKIDGIDVVVSRTSNIGVVLSLAAQSSLVEVSAQAVSIETTSSAVSGVVGPKTVQDLPMNGRDFRQMLKLAPGVSPTSSAVNGARSNGNNFQIDGADNNDAFQNSAAVNQGGVQGIAGTLLPVEAIDQFAVQTQGSAEVGRNGGASVNMVIKSGTNSLHGSVYYFNRNEALAANSPFAADGTPNRKIRNNQYGFSVGGPIIKNKTFFFTTGEVQKAVAANSLLDTAPSDAYVTNVKAVLAKYGVPVNPVSVNLLGLWPSRTRTGPAAANNFLSADQNDYNSYNGIIKIDHVFSAATNLAFRYYGGTGTQTAQVNSPIREYFQVAPSRMHNYSAVLSHVFTPRMVSQTTFGVNYFKQTFNDFDISANAVALGLNTGVTEPTLLGSPTINVTGFMNVGSTQPLGRIDTTGHFVENLSYNIGRHQLKFGAEYRRAQLDVFYEINKRGTFTFDGATGPWKSDSSVSSNEKALADFIAGYFSASSGARIARGDLQRVYQQNSFDWWVHDNYQITSRLNINFGVRYTYHGVLNDDKNSLTNFIPSRGIVAVKDLGSLYPSDKNNFAPRFGFAYQPLKSNKTVIRGGYGVYFDVPALNFFTANTSVPNGGAAGVNANPGGSNPVYSISLNGSTSNAIKSGVPIFGTASPLPPFGVFGVSQDFRTPYIQQFNLNVQQELTSKTLLQVGYSGSLGRKLALLVDINAATPGTLSAGSIQQRRPFYSKYPDLAAINMAETAGNSNYSSLQMSINQRFWKGLSGQVAYTLGHALDNGSATRNTLPANSYNLTAERGDAGFDIRNIFTSYLSYDLPNFVKKAPRLGTGWQFNLLSTLHTGEPLDIAAGTNVSQSGDSKDRADQIGDPFSGIVQPAAPSKSIRWLNKAAFAAPAAGTFGNYVRDSLRGPGFGSFDFSVFKTTSITEKIKAQFRVEIFNLLNRANYANPNTTYSSGSFGLISNTRNGGSAPGLGFGEPRNLQLALKIMF